LYKVALPSDLQKLNFVSGAKSWQALLYHSMHQWPANWTWRGVQSETGQSGYDKRPAKINFCSRSNQSFAKMALPGGLQTSLLAMHSLILYGPIWRHLFGGRSAMDTVAQPIGLQNFTVGAIVIRIWQSQLRHWPQGLDIWHTFSQSQRPAKLDV
jgi:hypothetical protein